MVYSLADIIKDRRYLNNPEVIRPDPLANIKWNYFVYEDAVPVLAYNKNKALGWKIIAELLGIDINPKEQTSSNYSIYNELTPELQDKIKHCGMVFHP